MGLDMYIDKCRKPIVKEDGRRDYEEREEMCYWRKFWDLFHIFNYTNDDYGRDVRLTKDDVEKILDFVTHNRDYFYGFKSVESVCELLDQWDELEADGWVINFNANWQ